jgi:hypothetical protein
LFNGSRNSTVPNDEPPPSPPVVLEEIVLEFIASLKVAVIGVAGSTFVAPAAGKRDVMVGGVVSTGGVAVNTTSAQ